MSTVDAAIDALYQLPPGDFTAARNTLARTLTGDRAKAVRQLEKPTLVPWSINQLYWRERKTFDRLIASGRALRTAQLSALKGRSADLRAAASDHRTALADAAATATQLAAQAGLHPHAEPLSRMLEAVSLAAELPAPPGRLTALLQPAGFEALAGVTPVVRKSRSPAPVTAVEAAHVPTSAVERRRAAQSAAARSAARAEVHARQGAITRAQAAHKEAAARVRALQGELATAEAALSNARDALQRAEHDLARATAALELL